MNILDELLTSVNALRTDVATLRAELAQQARPVEEDRYIGTKAAAALIGRKQDWVRDNIQHIPHSRIPGGQLQFSTLELKAWMEARFEAGKQPTAQEAAAVAMRGRKYAGAGTGAGRRNTTRSKRLPPAPAPAPAN